MEEFLLNGSPLSTTITLLLSTAGPFWKLSVVALGALLFGPPPPVAAIENIAAPRMSSAAATVIRAYELIEFVSLEWDFIEF